MNDDIIENNPPVYPLAVCIFCKHSFSTKTKGGPACQADDYHCEKHKYQRIIHPVSGEACYYAINKEGEFIGFIPIQYSSEYVHSESVNDGNCVDFERDKQKASKLLIQRKTVKPIFVREKKLKK